MLIQIWKIQICCQCCRFPRWSLVNSKAKFNDDANLDFKGKITEMQIPMTFERNSYFI